MRCPVSEHWWSYTLLAPARSIPLSSPCPSTSCQTTTKPVSLLQPGSSSTRTALLPEQPPKKMHLPLQHCFAPRPCHRWGPPTGIQSCSVHVSNFAGLANAVTTGANRQGGEQDLLLLSGQQQRQKHSVPSSTPDGIELQIWCQVAHGRGGAPGRT